MKKPLLTLLFLFYCHALVLATHNRAGEITFKQLSSLTFEITINTFTYTLSPADRSQLEVQWGDNSTSIAPRVEKDVLPNYYFHNIYKTTHTYSGPGTYTIVVQDPNRNYGVLNIPNSVNVIFCIQTSLVISPQLGDNNTPVLLNFPIDKAALHHKFIHNPGAYDADGDSLSYKLTKCRKESGVVITGYTYPEADKKFYVDSIKGDLVWDAPVDTGIYNAAMLVIAWKKGVQIGQIERDMQIEVRNVKNKAPVIDSLPDYCIVAGDSVIFNITARDSDNDSITISSTGGPYILSNNPATLTSISKSPGISVSRFKWKTLPEHVRKQPYSLIIKATDNSSEMNLVDIRNLNITVLAPAPKNLTTTSSNNLIKLRWNRSVCSKATGYYIYRKEGPYNFTPDSCTTGVPTSTGYMKIGSTSSLTDTSYTDNDNGLGLNQGIQYCYRVIAIFSDGGQSIASAEACDVLVPGNPAITNVSVTKIDNTNGEITIKWIKPLKLDTIPALGPYLYKIYRSGDLAGDNLVAIDSFQTTDLDDTTYLNSAINTTLYPYSYKVELWNNTSGNRFLIGTPEIASSLYLTATPANKRLTINMVKNVPWVTTSYVVYRQNKTTLEFDSIGTTSTDVYTDSTLKNGINYCFKAKSIGWRHANNGKVYNTENLSHLICGTPLDTVAPCVPSLTLASDCNLMKNILSWTNPNITCGTQSDVIRYNIYFSSTYNGTLTLIDSILDPNITTYTHIPENSLAGCYAVTAIDSVHNESKPTNRVCIDSCDFYKLPNVFSPNGDNEHDFYISYNPNDFVKKVDMKIFNRTGQLIYKTDNPAINWDGKIMNTNKLVSTGVYFYICDVYEERLMGQIIRNMVGFIHVYTGDGSSSNNQ